VQQRLVLNAEYPNLLSSPPMAKPSLLGIPFDAYSSFASGPVQAPARIREAFHSTASNFWTETGVDLAPAGTVLDSGDLALSSDEAAFQEIETAILRQLEKRLCPVSLGGDHSITLPIMRAIAHVYPKVTIVHFDAHPDLYDEFEGNRHSHACPFARLMEEKLASRLIQVGLRTVNGHQREQAHKFGVEQYVMRALPPAKVLNLSGPVYVSFDIDVLDPAFAPGVSHREPGGLTTREAIRFIHAIEGQIVGADLVEYNPARDLDGTTATTAAKILKEILGMVIEISK
jgi:agmatinase